MENIKIQKLNMAKNNIQKSGLKAVLLALIDNFVMSNLNLSENNFSKAVFDRIVSILELNIYLKVLNLSRCELTSVHIEKLARSLYVVTVTNADVKTTSQKGLEELYLAGN